MDRLRQLPHSYLDKYLTEVRAQGRYAFTLEELKSEFALSYPALKQNLYLLKLKKAVARIRQGFYVIIPPEYSKQGMLPPYLFVDERISALFSFFCKYPEALQHVVEAQRYGNIRYNPADFIIYPGERCDQVGAGNFKDNAACEHRCKP